MVPKEKGSWRFFVNVSAGFDFEGGHDEHHGWDANGNLIDVPLHRHAVSLDFTHIEPEVQHTFADQWDVWLRVPYDYKDQSVSIALVEPSTPAEREAMQRNSEIHHRNATYQGLGDPKLLLAHWHPNFLRHDSALELAVGTSIPIGRTEADPLKAGDAGQEHLHIQFGTGTFDPLLELYYAMPLPRSFVLRGFGLGHFPIYENEKTFRAPLETTLGLSIAQDDLIPRVSLRAVYTFFYQGYGYWDGVKDPNSGLISNGVVLGATGDLEWNTSLGLGFRYTFAQRTLSNEGDAFEQGPTLLFTLTHTISPNREE